MAALPNQSPLLFVNKPTISIPSISECISSCTPPAPTHAAESKRCCFDGCKKKLTLTDFPCKCGKKHCSAHRPAELHKCSFDYKQQHTSTLLKTMSEAVVAGKINKI